MQRVQQLVEQRQRRHDAAARTSPTRPFAQRHPRRGLHAGLAAERSGDYEPDGPETGTSAAPTDQVIGLETLESATDAVVGLALEDLSDDIVRSAMRRIQRCVDRLVGARTTAAGVLEQRALLAAGPGREAQALRTVRQATADELRLSPSQVKRDGETGRRVAERPAQAAALRAGDLPPDHARVLADTLRHLDPEVRDALEPELLAAAAREDAVTFGRTCRRRLAEVDAAAARSAQDRRNARRSLRMTQTPDGMLALHAEGSGLAAEVVATALHAFRRPDAPDERRSSEQASWDALEQVCRAALDAGTAATDRGVRPHVHVLVSHEDVVATAASRGGRSTGVAETTWTGPLPWSELRPLLADAGVARLLVDARGLPMEASEEVRTVPLGVWRAVQVRDRTCIGSGCTVPAAWCQMMHLDVPYRLGGRLSLDTSALGCGYHHAKLDRHGWVVTWQDGRPVLHPPGSSQGPAGAASRDGGPPSDGGSPPGGVTSPPGGTTPAADGSTPAAGREPPNRPKPLARREPPGRPAPSGRREAPDRPAPPAGPEPRAGREPPAPTR